MKKFFCVLCACLGAYAEDRPYAQVVQTSGNNVWGKARLENINLYEDGLAPLFVQLQSSGFFAWLALGASLAVILSFLGHYLIVGAKHFDHHAGKPVLAFTLFERCFHFVAASSWAILVPTGLIMMFGESFGGGSFVRFCKNAHGIATIAFAIAVIPMFVLWFWRMLPRFYDIKWMIIMGGYLSKTKRAIPAGKFNAGQKAWFWIATVGGMVMIATGASMYFLDYSAPAVNSALGGMSQIEVLRASVIAHNLLGAVCAVFLCVHIYMTVFAISGAIHSMIDGHKPEEEVYVLHHYWYRELLDKGSVSKSQFEEKYPRL
ncbi:MULTISPECIES: formate dehydrogenase subunit gamma [unclassified Campylobacter]|uniref:formate dehydrogenase subunit gamma n=1 Tax=unclassified Campylobacter TaxID=2593542 RepID=UPI0022E9CB4F|nr:MULTISPECIES: formate dehydrogenase subunit gamma [unclassified Campylobacter]MDA3045112.1 formate dehydrogenase subunit gamma [Campylobacter sp. JMF_07 ED4]MDA3064288.1 formate dehydrogenase subunit gamma [Campylobacter sp. JMF_11 EL3]MDA3072412.1 formate dehydrogenase subunit gamma [Campylobacter sp. VBCF_03 NA9]MDA3075476.1 formate dehydrogenase subunit gamma [Campylobacter sp. JMF_05 ED3]